MGQASLGPLALDLSMRPPGEAMDLADFVGQSSLDAGLLQRIWTALGFPDAGAVPVRVTPDVAEALEVLGLLAADMGEAPVLGFARVVGSTVARMADALSAATRVGKEIPQLESGMPYAQVAREYCATARDLLPVMWDVIGAVFRRHLVMGAYAQWTPDPERVAVTHDRTIGFADLVGSTEVLTRFSVRELAVLVDEFEQLVWEIVAATGGRVVKLIGDEAMFVHERPQDACSAAARLVEASPHPIRVGLAHGNVVALRGDYYGPTVNLAARLVAVAPPASVIVSDAVRGRTSSCAFEPYDTGPLRGFPEDTAAFRLESG